MVFKKIKYYKTLSYLPIWNWYKLNNTNDIKYLIKMDYEQDIKLHPLKLLQLKKVQNDLIYQFEKIEAPLLKRKHQIFLAALELLIDIADNSEDYDNINKAIIVLNELMISSNPNTELLYEAKFAESSQQKGLITNLAVQIKALEFQSKNKPEIKQTLEEKTARIESGLGVNIDIKTCSVLQYLAYENEYKTKLKQNATR